MIEKEKWMRKGAFVRANGKPGIILKMEENTIRDVDYVYYITVKTEERTGRYHPNDIEKLD